MSPITNMEAEVTLEIISDKFNAGRSAGRLLWDKLFPATTYLQLEVVINYDTTWIRHGDHTHTHTHTNTHTHTHTHTRDQHADTEAPLHYVAGFFGFTLPKYINNVTFVH
jgi:ABC-type nickel/cobalt efflux system permease component RcnA